MARHYFEWKGKTLWLDGKLKNALDTVAYNVKYNKKGNWDCMIIISGDRMVRTGKSTIAQLCATYLAYRFKTDYSLQDLYFDSEQMIEEAMKKPKFSINHYDEARRTLASAKRSKMQQSIIDFFTECGFLYQIMILVLPDFFVLNEEMAVARSECLINVYRSEKQILKDVFGDGEKIPVVEWDRGKFSFFNRTKKAYLYDQFQRTRRKDYFATRSNFNGDFNEFHILDMEEYENKKAEALKKYRKNTKQSMKETQYKKFRDAKIKELHGDGMNCREISDFLSENLSYEITRQQIANIIRESNKKTGDESI